MKTHKKLNSYEHLKPSKLEIAMKALQKKYDDKPAHEKQKKEKPVQEKETKVKSENKDILDRKGEHEFEFKNSTNIDKIEKDIKKDNDMVNAKVDSILKNQLKDSKKVSVKVN